MVIAQFDATANDAPANPKLSVRGYPTLYFVTAKGDSESMCCMGRWVLDVFSELVAGLGLVRRQHSPGGLQRVGAGMLLLLLLLPPLRLPFTCLSLPVLGCPS